MREKSSGFILGDMEAVGSATYREMQRLLAEGEIRCSYWQVGAEEGALFLISHIVPALPFTLSPTCHSFI